MNAKNTLFGLVMFLALLLTASASFNQTGSALQETETTFELSSSQMNLLTGELHEESEEKHFCRVFLVLVKEPLPTMHLMQSNEQFTIAATFNSNITVEQRIVIRQAITEWEEIIETRGFTPALYPIEFSNGLMPEETLGSTVVSIGQQTGDLYSAEIMLNNHESNAWFIDPTPAEDSEFDEAPPSGYDLLTVVRHEIGHAVGWIETTHVKSLIRDNVFDIDRLNIATTYPESMHSDSHIHVDDLMSTKLGPSKRRSISQYPTCSLVARAYHYDITMKFVDGTYRSNGRGSVNDPWDTFTEGIIWTPSGNQMLVIPGIYQETIPLILSAPMTIRAARGGNAVITGP